MSNYPLDLTPTAVPSAWLGFEARAHDPQSFTRRPITPRSIWVAGEFDPIAPRIGVVGARRANGAQLIQASHVCRMLAKAGATIVSGGADGVDTAAHRAALSVGGATVVCLPAGIANGGSAAQRALCAEVLRCGGVVVSCERPKTAHQRGGYRRRNAVIVGLIDALIVVCGGSQSGTLITAGMANRAAIPRRAIPWSPGTPCSDGSNQLLADGWRALVGINDGEVALDRLLSDCTIDAAVRGWQRYAPSKPRQPSPLRGPAGTNPQLVAAIDRALAQRPDEGLSLEELVEAHGGDRGQLAALLLHLRMTNQIEAAAFGRYVRCG